MGALHFICENDLSKSLWAEVVNSANYVLNTSLLCPISLDWCPNQNDQGQANDPEIDPKTSQDAYAQADNMNIESSSNN